MVTQPSPDTDEQSRAAAETYFDAWRAKDWDRLRSVIADTATFRGPLGQAEGVDDCVRGLQGVAELVDDIIVLKRFTNGPDVVTWFELRTANGPVPTANWSHVEDGRITRIRVTFDPRPLLAGD